MPHGDNHDLWIDPADPHRMIEGNDGGATITFNGGQSWSTQLNQPTAQFYHVAADNAIPVSPLRRAAGQHDDLGSRPIRLRPHHASRNGRPSAAARTATSRPARTIRTSSTPPIITSSNRYDRQHAPDARHLAEPRNALRVGRGRHQLPLLVDVSGDGLAARSEDAVRDVAVRPSDDERGTELGDHQPGPDARTIRRRSSTRRRIPIRTTDEYWGPITREAYGPEWYATIFAFAESPAKAGVLWAGSDDGWVHVSRTTARPGTR